MFHLLYKENLLIYTDTRCSSYDLCKLWHSVLCLFIKAIRSGTKTESKNNTSSGVKHVLLCVFTIPDVSPSLWWDILSGETETVSVLSLSMPHHRMGNTSGIVNTHNKMWLTPKESVVISNSNNTSLSEK